MKLQDWAIWLTLLVCSCLCSDDNPYDNTALVDAFLIGYNGNITTSLTCDGRTANLTNGFFNESSFVIGGPARTDNGTIIDQNPIYISLLYTGGNSTAAADTIIFSSYSYTNGSDEVGESGLDLEPSSGKTEWSDTAIDGEKGYKLSGSQRSVSVATQSDGSWVDIPVVRMPGDAKCSISNLQLWLDGTFDYNFTLSFTNTTALLELSALIPAGSNLSARILSFSYFGKRAPESTISLDAANPTKPVFIDQATGRNSTANYTYTDPNATDMARSYASTVSLAAWQVSVILALLLLSVVG